MREFDVERLTEAVERLSVDANVFLPDDIWKALAKAKENETGEPAKSILGDLEENYRIAEKTGVPICQDTGMACVFLSVGQEVYFVGGSVEDAVNEGVRRGYERGYLRKSVVADPLRRENTNDNTPAVIYIRIVPGDRITLTVAPKGFGSENKSAIRMLTPADGRDGVTAFVLETVKKAGADPCPPIVVGVGLGGTFDKAALLAKRALLRPVSEHHADPYYAALEEELLRKINALGIGAQGMGGRTTALGVNIETMPTHIAGLPCAVNISCHVTRHKTEVL